MKLSVKKKSTKKKYVQPKAEAVSIKMGVWGGSGTCVSNTTRCLHPSTLISTPTGYKSIKMLKRNERIWTLDGNGTKVVGKIVTVSKSLTSQTHHLIHLTLADRREMLVSPLHPLSDYEKDIRDLQRMPKYDGARIVSISHYYYPNQYTYDILPSGETGSYWANGILLGSTLSRNAPEKPIKIVERLISVVEFNTF